MVNLQWYLIFVSSVLMLKNLREKLENLFFLLLKHLWSSWLINNTPLYHSSSKVLFVNFTLYWESSTVHCTLSWVFLITHSSLTDQENILQMVSAYQFFSYIPCIPLLLVYTSFSENRLGLFTRCSTDHLNVFKP